MTHSTRAGFVGLIGRPNVGKSTLLNALVGEKVSIVTSHPQTTRHVVRGIVTRDDIQMILVDTPGIHEKRPHAINRRMNRSALGTLGDVDLNLFIVQADQWRGEDEKVLTALKQHDVPVGLVLNKIDQIHPRDALLPIIAELQKKHDFAFVVPLSALKNKNVSALADEVKPFLPEGPFMYEADRVMDRDDAFYVSELIREQLARRMRDELPFALAVEIESDIQEGRLRRLSAIIWVSRQSQKGIVVGKQGERLRDAGTYVRQQLEERWGGKVFLQLWVKVRKNWSDDDLALDRMGFDHE